MQSDRVSVVSRCSSAMWLFTSRFIFARMCSHSLVVRFLPVSLRCRKLGSRSNWSYKPLPVKEQLQRRLHATRHSPTYCNYQNKPQRNSYDYSNHTVHKGHVWEHLGILKPFNIHVTHKLITTLRQLTTNMKDKDEPKNRQSGLYEAHYRLGLCTMPNLQY